MSEVVARIEIEKVEGVAPEITKEKWKTKQALFFKLEPMYIPEWKKDLLPPLPNISIKPISRPLEKTFIIDLETTGAWPTNSRIICIGLMNISEETRPVYQFFDEDEKVLLEAFVNFIKKELPSKLVGWNVDWDIMFIFNRLAAHRIEAKELFQVDLIDLMDVYRRGTFKKVTTFNKPNKLDYVAKYILGKERLLRPTQILHAWKRRDIDKIFRHNIRDLLIIGALYDIALYVFGRKEELIGVEERIELKRAIE